MKKTKSFLLSACQVRDWLREAAGPVVSAFFKAGNLIDVRTDLKLDEQQTRQSISSVGESFRGILFHMLNKCK